MPEKILNISPEIDLKQCLLWQYQNSAKLKSLILSKEAWYSANQAQFWQDWYDNIFNIDTANDFGLSVWGEILDFSRNVKTRTGEAHYLTTDQYRMVLKGQMLRFGMGVSAPEVNEWLSVVFKGVTAHCVDTYDMTAIPFVCRSTPSPEITWLLSNVDFLVRPAGVGYKVLIVPNDVFGFNGSGLKPFNQGVFANDYGEELSPSDPDMYQLNIIAPEGATVTINGAQKKWALIAKGDPYTWEVSQDGYVPATGSGTMQIDENIKISALRINNTSGIGSVFVNNHNATGAFFMNGTNFEYNYSVGFPDNIPLNGSGVITSDSTINVSHLAINPQPEQATVVLNGEHARGAFFPTGDVYEYEYSVSYPGFTTSSDSGFVVDNAVIQAAAISGKYQRGGISTDNGGGVRDIDTYTVPLNGVINLVIAAEAGRSTSYNGGYGAKATVTNLHVKQGDVLKFVKINGAYVIPGGLKPVSIGGCGIALYINGHLKFVAGGGGHVVSMESGAAAAGGGYAGGGGFTAQIYGGQTIYVANYSGFSHDGARGRSVSRVLVNGDGEYVAKINGASHKLRKLLLMANGGSGFNGFDNSVSVSYATHQGIGSIDLTFVPN